MLLIPWMTSRAFYVVLGYYILVSFLKHKVTKLTLVTNLVAIISVMKKVEHAEVCREWVFNVR